MLKHIDQISEQAFLLDFGSVINIELSKYVISYSNYILKEAKKNKKPGVLDAETPVCERSVKEASHVAFSMQGLESFTNTKSTSTATYSLSTSS